MQTKTGNIRSHCCDNLSSHMLTVMQGVLEDVEAAKDNTVVFVDEVHLLLGAGSSDGGLNAANLMKPALARGHLRFIGATTLSEWAEVRSMGATR